MPMSEVRRRRVVRQAADRSTDRPAEPTNATTPGWHPAPLLARPEPLRRQAADAAGRRDPLGGACDVDASLVLFHEAMHGVAPPHVDCPDNPDDACDRTWRGSYGLQAGLAERLLASCDPETEPERCAIIELSLEHATASVIRD